MSELTCVPSAIPIGARLKHFALARRLFSARALERRDLPDGYAIRFAHDDYDAVTRFVANERLCCPFLHFDVRVEADGGALWLQMTGPQGTREVLQAELKLTGKCGCESTSSTTQRAAKWTTLAGLLCALAVCAASCLLPFVLISAGIAGSWIGALQAFARYRWPLVVLTVAFLAYGFRAAYWPRGRRSGAAEAGMVSRSGRAVRLWLWVATVLAVCGFLFNQVERFLRK